MQLCGYLGPFVELCHPVVVDEIVVDARSSVPILYVCVVKSFRKDEVVVAVDGVPVADDEVFVPSHPILTPQNDVVIGL